MSTQAKSSLPAGLSGNGALPSWAPLALGLLLMYVPSFYDMFTGLWSTEEQAHGPIILGISHWLLYRNWGQMLAVSEGERGSWLGWPLLVLSVFVYFIGRSQGIAIFEIGSYLGTLMALILLMRGTRALRAQWFPFFFMLFMLPLPGSLVDMLTMPMKTAVSWVVGNVLYWVGYPISRSGVILQIGQYKLLVADACAGLHTLFTLEALGLLYLNIVRHNSLFRNITLAILIVPISFISNVIRVMVLTLITYHLGDAAGQGFLHGFAGMVLFVSALLLIIATDSLLRFGAADKEALPLFAGAAGPPALSADYGPLRMALPAALLMGAALLATLAIKPQKMLADSEPAIVLETSVPGAFGDWKIDPDAVAVVPSSVQQEKVAAIYSQTLSRTYINSRGQRVMLTIAYGSNQTQSMRAHRQEVCYAAQGFQIRDLHNENIVIDGLPVPVTRMVASNGPRIEPVTYWFTMGSSVVRSYLDRQVVQLKYALSDFIPDGYLFRVSAIDADDKAAFAAQDAFVNDLMKHVAPTVRAKLIGAPA
ncbi:exosortase B [Massilia sp. CCM 9210]|uniref:exosortase B n=1 Tax=Massilia scottii TaxID=3057166 RepID=UPI0027967B8E|nr:exosortase B [Massilia sp. CCM 9210]MDQ1815245.1 exosortase B [Massilia sp. CCM 9210]